MPAIFVSSPNTFYPTYEEWKLSRNITVEGFVFAFYPTYEEWKHLILDFKASLIISFYPTYEEWKLPNLSSHSKNNLYAFYPTYEEWKPSY